jgi:5-(carboxyamino)imidazole ribonucleotide synthase
MIGAGQLARMSHQAAVDLGFRLEVLAGADDDPAVLAGAGYQLGSVDSFEDLVQAASGAEVVTFDHELVPPEHLARLEAGGHLLRPGARALLAAQDKLHARRLISGLGHPVPRWAPVLGAADVVDFAAQNSWPVVLKARRGGYDGRGVQILAGPDEMPPGLGPTVGVAGTEPEPEWIVEEYLDLSSELAVLTARRPAGQTAVYPCVRTRQVDGICVELVMPAGVDPDLIYKATTMAGSIVEAIGAVGIVAVELFVSSDGRLLVNELALRPHNSGHATIEACHTSQFHQHLRAVLDLPLGSTELVAPSAATVNVIGTATTDLAASLPRALEVPDASIHLYGKTPRPGRKLGHVTVLAADGPTALVQARRAADILSGK